MTPTDVTARTATKDDAGSLAAVLARAFADDPPCAWILRNGKDRTKRLDRLFLTTLRADAMRNAGAVEVAISGGQVVGGAIWCVGSWQCLVHLLMVVI